MLIDWFTVGAQMFNFAVLMWLLKRYLYKPILRAIDAREKKIADELADAKAKQAEAETEREAYLRKNADFDNQKAELLRQATEETKAERQRLLDTARSESEALRTRLQENWRNEQRSLGREITLRTQKEVFAIARKTLADLAAAGIEGRMAEVFVSRLRKLSGAETQALLPAAASPAGPALLRSAFELPQRQRLMIEAAVKDTLGPETELRFETAPDLISGVELSVNGHKLAWSIDDYLTALAGHIGDALDKPAGQNGPGPKRPPEGKQRAADHAAGQLA